MCHLNSREKLIEKYDGHHLSSTPQTSLKYIALVFLSPRNDVEKYDCEKIVAAFRQKNYVIRPHQAYQMWKEFSRQRFKQDWIPVDKAIETMSSKPGFVREYGAISIFNLLTGYWEEAITVTD